MQKVIRITHGSLFSINLSLTINQFRSLLILNLLLSNKPDSLRHFSDPGINLLLPCFVKWQWEFVEGDFNRVKKVLNHYRYRYHCAVSSDVGDNGVPNPTIPIAINRR